jgi:hypothetical protein
MARDEARAANVIGRVLGPDAWELDRAWSGHISYASTRERWAYLATVICLATSALVGRTLSDQMGTDLVAERPAHRHHQPAAGAGPHVPLGQGLSVRGGAIPSSCSPSTTSPGRWGARPSARTTPRPNPGSRPTRPNSSAAARGPPSPGCVRRPSTTSRSSRTAAAATLPLAVSASSTTNTPARGRQSSGLTELSVNRGRSLCTFACVVWREVELTEGVEVREALSTGWRESCSGRFGEYGSHAPA